MRREDKLVRLVCKEDRPVSRLIILASPPEWEARRISSPEETDFELPVDSIESDLTLTSWNEPRPSVAGMRIPQKSSLNHKL